MLVDLAEHGARLEELAPASRAPRSDRASSTTTSSASAIVDSRWAMMIVVRPRITSRSAGTDPRLRRRVDRGGRVVEDEDARVDEQRPRDGDPLALPARQRDAALADDRVVPVGELEDELVRLCGACRRLDRLERRIRHAQRDVVADRRGEEERILGDDADLAAERAPREVADVDAVDDARARRVVS